MKKHYLSGLRVKESMGHPEVLTQSRQFYLAEILVFESDHGSVRQSEIAERMGVNRSSVTAALQRLAERNMIRYEPYEAVTLTPKGRAIAEAILVRRRIIREYLVTVLEISDDAAHDAARHMQCSVPDIVVEQFSARLEKLVHNPDRQERDL